MVGGALLGAVANRQVCPTISEMTFGNQSRQHGTRTTRQVNASTLLAQNYFVIAGRGRGLCRARTSV